MVVSLTHTLGVPSGVIPPGTGFMLNGAMNWYDPRPGRAGSIAPGKRRFSSMSPTIVFEGDTPVATLGAPGGAWIGVALLQVLLNLLDWGMTMQEAVMAPRFSATTDAIDISNRIPHDVQAGVGGAWLRGEARADQLPVRRPARHHHVGRRAGRRRRPAARRLCRKRFVTTGLLTRA